ncbi:DUF4357 domain-containing protein [Rhodobacteraceae bacterium RKSG542]|nr:DUF4357 domain-containing protein [Pseudovibrio flavus]
MADESGWLVIRKEQAEAYGKKLSEAEFLVRAGSTAMRVGSPNKKRNRPERDHLVEQGILVPDENTALFRFSVDHIFNSPSRAAGVVIDGNSNGSHWRPATMNLPTQVETPAPFTRREIEEAIDAFDRYSKNGEESEIFRHFDDPRDYWVRSSRDRENSVFPSKPIVGYLLNKTELNGAWGQKSDATARLHNAGFIIVDQNDQPIERPERYQHLMEGADRIRLCALNYFIEPARENAARQVSIRAGDLAAAMGLKDAFPNICRALGGEKFQNLAQVPPPTSTEPNPSSSTVFTYTLNSQPEADTVTDTNNAPSPSAVNLILYGPPGTGKTYQTAWEAVRLCVGAEAAAELKDDRDALTAEYRRLANEGRIEFVTFHQSMSYEEFIEGLQPSTGEDHTEGGPETERTAGFSLKCHQGIFKQISERARLDPGKNSSTKRLDRNQGLFKLSLIGEDWKDQLSAAIRNNKISWGLGSGIDWSGPEYIDFQAVKSRWLERNPGIDGRAADITGTWYFRSAVEPESYVLLTVGKNVLVALGRVVGDYEFDPTSTGAQHSRSVEWIWSNEQGARRSDFYPNTFSAFQPMYQLAADKVDWDALEKITFDEGTPHVGGTGRNHVLIIDEINRANISKVFGELITLLEQDKRLGAQNELYITLPYSKKRFGVPSNLHIVGTMNTADRSIALLDTALRRRFTFQELMPDPTVLSEDVGGINLRALLSTINERIEYLFDREHQIGHAYFTSCHSRADVEDVMRHKVIPLLAEYFYEDWAKVAAVLGDGPGMATEHFLQAVRIAPPKGMPEDDINGDKFRWNVKKNFDFSEFEA